jgi:hypothetical protein
MASARVMSFDESLHDDPRSAQSAEPQNRDPMHPHTVSFVFPSGAGG